MTTLLSAARLVSCLIFFTMLSSVPNSNAVPSQHMTHDNRFHEVPLVQNNFGGHTVEVHLNGRTFWLIVDSGATINAMPQEWLEQIGAMPTHSQINIVFAGGATQAVPTYNVEHVSIGTCAFRWTAFLAPKGHMPLLGGNVLERMGYVTIDYRRRVFQFRCPKD